MRGLEWFVARRYLASRRKGRRLLSLSTFIAIGGVAVGVMALLVVIGVMTGLQRDLQDKILSGTPHIFVFDQGTGVRLGNWRSVRERVLQIPGVEVAAPTSMSAVLIIRPGTEYSQPGVLYGLEADEKRAPLSEVERGIQAGEYSLGPAPAERDPDALPGVLIGNQLALKLVLMPGDTVAVASIENMDFNAASGNFIPSVRQFVVNGTPKTGMYEYDNVGVYAHMTDVQDLLNLPDDTIGTLAINIAEPWDAPEISTRIADELGYSFRIQNWVDMHGSLFGALKLEKLAMSVILSLIIVVAAFNIVGMLTMVVADKRREIGILKSMGMTDGAVLRIFMLQGLTIGAIGTLLGGLLGWLLIVVLQRYDLIQLPADVYFIETLPVALDPFDVILIVTVSLVIAFGATIYPALQAARLDPVEAIRE